MVFIQAWKNTNIRPSLGVPMLLGSSFLTHRSIADYISLPCAQRGEAWSCLGMPDDPTLPGERHFRPQKSWHAVFMAHPVILLKALMVNTSILQPPKL